MIFFPSAGQNMSGRHHRSMVTSAPGGILCIINRRITLIIPDYDRVINDKCEGYEEPL